MITTELENLYGSMGISKEVFAYGERIIEELKDRFEIYPKTCNKKKFAEIVYILHRCQWYIGMKTNGIKTYKKFMHLMCLYYEYPETTYKINDIKDDAMQLMRKDSYFNDFKIDGSL
jgi:hypothetical protein